MDAAFAVQSIVNHYDAAQADKNAVMALLSSLGGGHVALRLEGKSSTSLQLYLSQPAADRSRVVGLAQKSTSQHPLVQSVAVVLAIANVRAAADTASVVGAPELVVACTTLERLLLPLTDPFRARMSNLESEKAREEYAPASALVLSTSLSRRRRRRTTTATDADRSGTVSKLLVAICASLRLCDIAAHVLTVAVQGNLKDKSVCALAFETSRRLLKLAACLPRDEKCTTSLNFAVECACYRIGNVVVEHVDLDPGEWISTALQLVQGSSGVHVALFGGMIRGSQSYADAKLDPGSISRAATTLATLLIALDSVFCEESCAERGDVGASIALAGASHTRPSADALADNPDDKAAHHAAALEFLGERVVSVEDDVHGVHPSGFPSSPLGACNAYCELAGHTGQTFGFVLSFLLAAARQCSAEVLAETDVVLPILAHGCESEALDGVATPSGTPRSEAQFPMPDVFDLRSPSSNPPLLDPMSNPSEPAAFDGGPNTDSLRTDLSSCVSGPWHADSHREIGSLALDSLTLLVAMATNSHQSVFLEGIVSAAEAATKLSCLTLSNSDAFSVRKGYDPQNEIRSEREGVKMSSCDEETLLASIEEFANEAAGWMLRTGLSTEELESLSTKLASGRCSAVLVGRLLAFTSADFTGEVVVRAFVSRLLHGIDDDCEGRCSVSRVESFDALDYISTLFSDMSSELYLNIILDLVEDGLDGATFHERNAVARYESLALVMASTYALQCVMCGCETARSYLSTAVSAVVAALREGIGETETTRYESGYVALPERDTWETEERSLNFAAVCWRFSKVLSTYFDILTVKHMTLAVAWDSKAALEVEKALQPEAVRLQLFSRLCVSAIVIALGPCGGSLYTPQSLVAGHRPTSPVSTGRNVFSPYAPAAVAFGEERFLPLTNILLRKSNRSDSNKSTLGAVMLLAPKALQVDACMDLLDLVELDVAVWSAVHGLQIQGDTDQVLSAAELQDLFRLIFGCLTALKGEKVSFVRKPASSRVLQTFEGSMGNVDNFLRNRVVQFIDVSLAGSFLDLLGLVIESLGCLVDAVTSRCVIAHGAETIREAATLAVALREARHPAEESVVDWIRHAVQVSSSSLGPGDLDYSCSVILQGCHFGCVIATAERSRNGMDAFWALLGATQQEGVVKDALSAVLCGNYAMMNAACMDAVSGILPRAPLDGIIAGLVVPSDNSAVCVDAATRALAKVTVACQTSSVWALAVSSSLDRLCGSLETTTQVSAVSEALALNSFCELLCRRSILESVAMSSAVLQLAMSAVAADEGGNCVPVASERQSAGDGTWAVNLMRAGASILDTEGLYIDFESFCRVIEFSLTMACLSDSRRSEANSDNVEESHIYNVLVLLSAVARRLCTSADGRNGEGEGLDKEEKAKFIVDVLDAVSKRTFPRNDGKRTALNAVSNSDVKGGLGRVEAVPSDFAADEKDCALAKLSDETCTFSSTGSQFVEQHWYFCYTCGLTGSEGVCGVCAQVCHAGHDLSYSRHSKFFCDCGAKASSRANANGRQGGGARAVAARLEVAVGETAVVEAGSKIETERSVCACLRPRTQTARLIQEDGNTLERDHGHGSSFSTDVSRVTRDRIAKLFPLVVQEEDTVASEIESMLPSPEKRVAAARGALSSSVCTAALADVILNLLGCPSHFGPPVEAHRPSMGLDGECLVSGRQASRLHHKLDIGKVSAFAKNRISDFMRAGLLSAGSKASFGSPVGYSPSTGLLAIAEVDNRISFFRMMSLPRSEHSVSSKVLSPLLNYVDLPFAVVTMHFDPETCSPESRLVVSGASAAVVLLLGRNGEALAQVNVPFGCGPGEAENTVLRVQWLPSERNCLLVVTRCFVKVFDVGEDSLSPAFFAQLPISMGSKRDDADGTEYIEDASVLFCPVERCSKLFVLSSAGTVRQAHLRSTYRGPIDLEDEYNLLSLHSSGRRCVSLGTSDSPTMLWGLCDDGSISLFCPANGRSCRINGVLPLGTCCEVVQVPTYDDCASMLVFAKGADVSHATWLRVECDGSILFQKCTSDAARKVEGIFVVPADVRGEYSSASSAGFILDDGSLTILVHSRKAILNGMPKRFWKVAQDISSYELVDLKAEMQSESFEQSLFDCRPDSMIKYSNPVPSVVGFFESCRLTAGDVSFSGDVETVQAPVANNGRSSSGDLPSSRASVGSRLLFKSSKPGRTLRIVLTCSNSSLAMVGVRVQVCASDSSRASMPGDIRVFGRPVHWETDQECGKRWIDVPFTVPESVCSPGKALLEIFPRRKADGSFAKSGLVIVDAVEVYTVQAAELSSRKRKFEKNVIAFNKRVKAILSKRRRLHLSKRTLSENEGEESGMPMDSWTGCLLSCLRILAANEVKLNEAASCNLFCELSLHDTRLAAAAASRCCDCSSETQSFVSSMHLAERLAGFGCFSEIHFRLAQCQFTEHFLKCSICNPSRNGGTVRLNVLERGLFLLAKVVRSTAMHADVFVKDEVVGSLLRHDILEGICNAMIASRRSEEAAVISRRQLCSNVMDILFIALELRRRAVRESTGRTSQIFGDHTWVVRLIVRLLTTSPAWMRLLCYRRVVELFQALPSPENCTPDGFMWFTPALFEHGADRQLRSDASEGRTDDGSDILHGADDNDAGAQWTFRCDVCGEVCESAWWHCHECGDFDLCKKCVNLRGSDLPLPHQENHILLRGMKDDIETTPLGVPDELPASCQLVRDTFGEIVGEIMKSFREIGTPHGAQLLESAQLLHRLVSPPSIPVWRSVFLEILFDKKSGLEEALRALIDATEPEDWAARGLWQSLPSSCGRLPGSSRLASMESAFVLIRMLACLRDVAAVPLLLGTSVLEQLSRFLSVLMPIVEKDVEYAHAPVDGGSNSDDGRRVSSVSCAKLHAVLPMIKDAVDVPISLLHVDKVPAAPSMISSVFGHCISGRASSPALETVGSLVDILHSCFASVAGPHFEEALTRIDLNSLCCLKFYGEMVRGSCEVYRHRGLEVNSRVSTSDGVLGDMYVAVGDKAHALLSILAGENDSAASDQMDQFALSFYTSKLHDFTLCEDSSGEVAVHSEELTVASTLDSLCSIASTQPASWRRFLKMQTGKQSPVGNWVTFSELYRACRRYTEGPRLQALQLIDWGTQCRDEEEPGGSVADEKSTENKTRLFEWLTCNSMECLNGIVEIALIHGRDGRCRAVGASIVQNVIDAGSRASDAELINSLGDLLGSYAGHLAVASGRGKELSDMLMSVVVAAANLQDGPIGAKWMSSLGITLVHLVKESTQLLSSHPNGHIYKSVASLMTLSGYYLEAEPCMSCSALADDGHAMATVALESLRAEVKFTDRAMYCRLASRHSVSSITLKIGDPNQFRLVKRVDVLASSRVVADAAELRSSDVAWKKVATMRLSRGQTEVFANLDVLPVVANLMFEFAEIYSSSSSSVLDAERMQCPRCSRQVADRYGICRSCGENVYQCRACRFINHEVLDGFLCHECGYCKHGRFEFSLSCAPAYDAEPVLCEADRKRAALTIQYEADRIRCKYDELQGLRLVLTQALSAPSSSMPLPFEQKSVVKESLKSISTGLQRPLSAARLMTGNMPSLDAADVESLLRNLVGEGEGGLSLPVVIGGGGGGSDSSEIAPSSRDLAGQLLRERANTFESHLRDEDSDPMTDRPGSVDSSAEGRMREAQSCHLVTYIAKLYEQDCKKTFTSMSKSIRTLISTRAELSRYAGTRRRYKGSCDEADSRESGSVCDGAFSVGEKRWTSSKCYGCSQSCVALSLPLLEMLVKENEKLRLHLCLEGFAVLLLRCGSLFETDGSRQAARHLVSALVRESPGTTSIVCEEIARKVEFCIESYHSMDARSAANMELAVLCDVAKIEDSCWEERLLLVFRLLLRAADVALESSAVSEFVVLPCLRAASDLVQEPVDGDDLSAKRDALESDSEGTLSNQARDDSVQGDVDVDYMRNSLEVDHEAGVSSVGFEKWIGGGIHFDSWMDGMLARKKSTSRLRNAGEDENDTAVLLKKCFRFWQLVKGGRESGVPYSEGPPDVDHQPAPTDASWAFRLILRATSARVRFETCELLETLCLGEDTLTLRLLDALIGAPLRDALAVGALSLEYFDLLERVLKPQSNRLYLLANEVLPRIAELAETEAFSLRDFESRSREDDSRLDLTRGYVLKRLVYLCRFLLDAIQSAPDGVRRRVLSPVGCKDSVVATFVRAYISVRRLVSIRTKLTDDSGEVLREMLSSFSYLYLQPAGEIVISACVAELKLAHSNDDGEAISSLLELLCEVLCPVKEDPSYSLILEKASSQEEFIRGAMSRDFYPSSEFDGPLMRDVKRKICQDLDLMSLLEDDMGDFGLELLVAGSLVNLDLPIASVYEHVWRNSAEAVEIQTTGPPRRAGLRRARTAVPPVRCSISRVPAAAAGASSKPPMVVIYRLSGLDGEATEPIVETLPSTNAHGADLEEEYKATEVLGRVGGLAIILDLLSIVDSWGGDAGVAVREPALRLLRASCEVAVNRARLAAMPGAVGILMGCVVSALNSTHESATALESAESLSIATEKILSENADSSVSDGNVAHSSVLVRDGDIVSRFRVVLGHLRVVSSPIAEAALLHLLPYLMHGSREATELAAEEFAVDWKALDDNLRSQRAATQLATVLAAWPIGLTGASLSAILLVRGVAEGAIDFVERQFPMPKDSHGDAWKVSLERPGTCLALNVLRGLANVVLSNADEGTAASRLRQVVIERGNVARICMLEMAVSSSGVGSAAEEFLESLSIDTEMGSAVSAERRKIRAMRRAAAEVARAAALAASRHPQAIVSARRDGVSSERGNDAAGSQPSASISFSPTMLLDVQDEVGPSCVVCGDGFTSRPADALGMYSFSRLVDLGWKTEPSVNTVEPEDHPQESQRLQRRAVFPFLVVSPSSSEGSVASRVRRTGRSRSESASGGNAEQCFTNVSHFNAIHLGCHREAARTDRSTRQPRDEWDGAALRNSQTKCNNVYPIMPPACFTQADNPSDSGMNAADQEASARASYIAAVDFYFARLTSFARTTLSQASQSAHDLAQSILRFGSGSPGVFAEYSHGGGPHSNACLIPHMLQLSWHLLNSKSAVPNPDEAAFQQLLATGLGAAAEMDPSDLPLLLALSVLSHNRSEWFSLSTALLCEQAEADGRFLSLPVLLRAIAFTHCLQCKLKAHCEPGDTEWQMHLSKRIAWDELWLIDVCNDITNVWEEEICSIASFDALRGFLERR
jgi:E3 ubiquitin-protein ligase UBR4